MANGRPPQQPPNLFAIGDFGVGNSLTTDLATAQLGADADGIMSMLDSSMYNGFDGMSMNLDATDDGSMSPSFSSVSIAKPQAFMSGDQRAGSDDNAGNVPGGGPMPATGLGNAVATPASMAASSTLTEFTKRRNWPAKVVEELKDFLQILDANGRIRHVSPSITALTGYSPEDVQDQFLRDLIHPDDVGVFVSELNESIATGNPLRLFYRLKKKDGDWAIFESVGHAHIAAAKFAPNPNNQSPFCQAVFMMSRPYPTKNASLLDSFLEHKIENERLRRRIAELRREEADDDAEESQRTWRESLEGQSDVTPSDVTPMHHYPGLGSVTPLLNQATAGEMPPPEKPASVGTALTRENLEGIVGSRPDSVSEKMARFEGATHADTIEMLTGLRYLEGERSRGITTGNSSPTLVKGDAGIAIPVDRDPRTGDKKKKLKVAEEYVCTDCGTLDSPEWRKGPSGPKTLCNACGLRWAKKEKKRHSAAGGGGGGGQAMDF